VQGGIGGGEWRNAETAVGIDPLLGILFWSSASMMTSFEMQRWTFFTFGCDERIIKVYFLERC